MYIMSPSVAVIVDSPAVKAVKSYECEGNYI